MQHSNSRKVNAVEAGRLKRNPQRVRCPELNERPSELRHRHSVRRGQCNSNSSSARHSSVRNRNNGRNHSRKPNVRDPRNSNSRKANALVVQPNDRNKTRGRNSKRSIKVVHPRNAAAVVAVKEKASLVNLKREGKAACG